MSCPGEVKVVIYGVQFTELALGCSEHWRIGLAFYLFCDFVFVLFYANPSSFYYEYACLAALQWSVNYLCILAVQCMAGIWWGGAACHYFAPLVYVVRCDVFSLFCFHIYTPHIIHIMWHLPAYFTTLLYVISCDMLSCFHLLMHHINAYYASLPLFRSATLGG